MSAFARVLAHFPSLDSKVPLDLLQVLQIALIAGVLITATNATVAHILGAHHKTRRRSCLSPMSGERSTSSRTGTACRLLPRFRCGSWRMRLTLSQSRRYRRRRRHLWRPEPQLMGRPTPSRRRRHHGSRPMASYAYARERQAPPPTRA